MLKSLRLLTFGVLSGLLLGLLAAGLIYLTCRRPDNPAAGRTELALSILKSDAMNFLVTRRLYSTVVLEKTESNWFLGERHGLLIADVELFYGFDLAKLDRQAIREDGEVLTVTLPEPALLTTSVDLEHLRYFTKQSALSLAADKFASRDLREELRREFAEAARQHFADRGLLPERAELLEAVNRWGGPFFAARQLQVRFQ